MRSGPRLGTYYLESGASMRPSKVIYDRAGSSCSLLKTGQVVRAAASRNLHRTRPRNQS